MDGEAAACLFCVDRPATPGQRDCERCRKRKRRQLAEIMRKAAQAWKPPPPLEGKGSR